MKFQKLTASFLIAGLMFSFSTSAHAHVTVWPKESNANSYERFTVRVPVEKEVNTVKVRVEFPAGVKIGTVLPVPGWNYELDKNSEGLFTAITWTAINGGIKPHEFMEFGLSGKNPKDPGTLTWKAYQTYADGSVVEWTGDPQSKTPAPVVTLKESAAAETPQHSAAQSSIPLILSGAALLAALISLFRKKA